MPIENYDGRGTLGRDANLVTNMISDNYGWGKPIAITVPAEIPFTEGFVPAEDEVRPIVSSTQFAMASRSAVQGDMREDGTVRIAASIQFAMQGHINDPAIQLHLAALRLLGVDVHTEPARTLLLQDDDVACLAITDHHDGE